MKKFLSVLLMLSIALPLSAQQPAQPTPDWAARRRIHERKYPELRHRKRLLQYYQDDPAFEGLTSLDTLISGYWVLTLGMTWVYPTMIGWKSESLDTPSRYEALEMAETYFRYNWTPDTKVYDTPMFRVYVKNQNIYKP